MDSAKQLVLMRAARLNRCRIADERGAITVMTAMLIPTIITLIGVVVIAAGWVQHKRALQNQVDAAALAAGQVWTCGADTGSAETEAGKYIGLNSRPSGAGSYGWTPTFTSTSDTCQIDIDATEQDVVPLVGTFAPSVSSITAHARVQAFRADQLAGALPLAVEDPKPASVWAQFIDEANANAAIGVPFRLDAINGTPVYRNIAGQSLTPTTSRIGVRILLSGNTTAPTCGAAGVRCYDDVAAAQPLFIQGWDATTVSSKQVPRVRSVTLTKQTGLCADAYFSNASGPCSMAVHAVVDWPSDVPATQRILRFNGLPLTRAGDGRTFDSNAATYLTLPAGAGPVPVSLDWEQTSGSIACTGKNVPLLACAKAGTDVTCTATKPCTGTFSNVQRTYSNADAGGIQSLSVLKSNVTANSLEKGIQHTLTVQVSLLEGLQTGDKRTLYYGGQNQPGGLDCIPADSVPSQFNTGCPRLAVNDGSACPAFTTTNIPTCSAVTTGNKTNQIAAGLNQRILGAEKPSTCTQPNNYQDGVTDYTGDKRLVQLVLTKFGAFSGSGQGFVPVTGFGTFYITGWGGSGGGFSNPCATAGDEAPDTATTGVFVVGHFLTYVEASELASGGTTPCQANTVNTCVVEMTQ